MPNRSAGNLRWSDRITTDKLTFHAVVETWHNASDCPDIIVCTPLGYGYHQKAYPGPPSEIASVRMNHGGVILVQLQNWRYMISLPVYNMFEVLRCYTHGSKLKVLVVVIYRPSSAAITNAFLNNFQDTSSYRKHMRHPSWRDISIHLDMEENPKPLSSDRHLTTTTSRNT